MKKLILILTLSFTVFMTPQEKNYTKVEKTDYIVTYNGQTVGVFPYLEESEQYISDQFEKNNEHNFEVAEYKYTVYEYVAPVNLAYILDKEKFKIVEGEVSKEVALQNRINMNRAIQNSVDNGFGLLEVGEIDAYFEIGALNFGNLTHREAIQIPSNFHFKMSDETILRVQPNNQIAYAVLSARSADNVKITGGKLLGDKYEHTYATGTQQDTHEFGFGVYIVGGSNIYKITDPNLNVDVNNQFDFKSS